MKCKRLPQQHQMNGRTDIGRRVEGTRAAGVGWSDTEKGRTDAT